MAKISAFIIRAVLKQPIEVEDEKVAELCNKLAWSIQVGSDLEYEIGHYTQSFGSDSYPLENIIVWSTEGKYGND